MLREPGTHVRVEAETAAGIKRREDSNGNGNHDYQNCVWHVLRFPRRLDSCQMLLPDQTGPDRPSLPAQLSCLALHVRGCFSQVSTDPTQSTWLVGSPNTPKFSNLISGLLVYWNIFSKHDVVVVDWTGLWCTMQAKFRGYLLNYSPLYSWWNKSPWIQICFRFVKKAPIYSSLVGFHRYLIPHLFHALFNVLLYMFFEWLKMKNQWWMLRKGHQIISSPNTNWAKEIW